MRQSGWPLLHEAAISEKLQGKPAQNAGQGAITMTTNGYLAADRVCDLIMKGGITSGVVYPPAIEEIAQRFWLCGIGGTSAGAIAAALAAAAELRRRKGSDEGFRALRDLPQEIGAQGRLSELFRPDAPTRRAFAVLNRSMNLKEHAKWWRVLRVLLDAGWLLLTQRPLTRLVENGLGLCTGMANGNRSAHEIIPPLTQWLSAKLDAFAGLPAGDRPLTFGDLLDAPLPATPGLAEAMAGATSIQLQLVTTCLTFGRPYALPNLDRAFAFDPGELRRYFPAYVCDYLESKGRAIVAAMSAPPPSPLLPLPIGRLMPVILAVRMSLSFPVLFSTVPLYYPNRFGKDQPYEKVYFSDGGITSNLPVYFFDSPFPRWPTLAVNLRYAESKGVYGRSNIGADKIWMAKTRRDGVLELFNHFLRADTPVGKLLGFAGAIFQSAQTWTDNSFLVLPAYRDRVAEIWLDPDEGGLNLDMPAATISTLADRGRDAGRQLVQRFADTPRTDPMSWDGHRWTRFRANAPALASYLRSLRHKLDHPMPKERSLWEMLASVDGAPCYRFSDRRPDAAEARRTAAEQGMRTFVQCAEFLESLAVCTGPGESDSRPFCDGPRPPVVLQSRASLVPIDEDAPGTPPSAKAV